MRKEFHTKGWKRGMLPSELASRKPSGALLYLWVRF
jgi:hypothetical protein